MGGFEAYLEKAEGRLKAAELLLENGFYSDAVSRAYYAIYNAAKAALSLKGKDARTHGGLIALFGEEFVKEGQIEREVGKAFSWVEEEREDADYEPLISISEEDARDSIKMARKFLSAVKVLPEGEDEANA